MHIKLRSLYLLVSFFFVLFCRAQENYTAYTTKDGLPSNYVYRTTEDDNGFLWVATDAGLARFDGRNMQVYTTADGLPDNVVFNVVKEKNGRIWVDCFNQIPAYFDEVQNRFIAPLDVKELAGMTNTLNTHLVALQSGGVMYSNRDKWIVFKDTRLRSYSKRAASLPHATLLDELPDGSLLLPAAITNKITNAQSRWLYHIKGEKVLDSTTIAIVHPNPEYRGGGMLLNSGNIYMVDRNSKKCVIFSQFGVNPLRFKKDSIYIPEPYVNCFILDKEIAFTTKSANLYVYDKSSLKLIRKLNEDLLLNSYFKDSNGNEWLSTIDKGLVTNYNRSLNTVKTPPSFTHTNYMSIARKDEQTLLAGNYYGEVLELGPKAYTVHKIIKQLPARIRKIIVVGNDVFTFSDEGIYCNYKQKIKDPDNPNLSFGKLAIKFNDTTIMVATNRNLSSIHTVTKRMTILNPQFKRITALAKADDRYVYFGSTDGLFKYDFKNDTYTSLHIKRSLQERIVALCYTDDGLLWVSTSGNKIVVLKNDRIILNAVLNKDLPDSSNRNLTAGRSGQVWVATSAGIDRIDYKYITGKLSYTRKSLSVIDGLSSNDVQELFYDRGMIYAATSSGISIIPEKYMAPVIDIPTYLVGMRINQKNAPITGLYHLSHRPQDIRMEFSGVDLNGYFRHFQYKLDDADTWLTLDHRTLTIQLRTGYHTLKVRAVDVNGNISKKTLVLNFDVAIPLWKNVWFWTVGGLILQIILIYWISRYQKRKKEARLNRKLADVQAAAIEQQAFTSLMNPHFIFNALNSIQYYINVQDRKNANHYLSDFASLIRRNFEAAQKSFIALEEEIENIKIYLNLEKMRFNDRLDYELLVDADVEVEDWMIPTMILQPLLENALLHGLMPSAVHGKLWVRFARQGDNLLIIVTDNGIGIINSRAYNGDNPHRSRGTELIEKRIRALRNFGSVPISITMQPAFESSSNPGNEVTILIPGPLYDAWRRTKTL